MATTENTEQPAAKTSKSGFRFGIPAAIPGALTAAALILGAPVVGVGAAVLGVGLVVATIAVATTAATAAVGAGAVAAGAVAVIAATGDAGAAAVIGVSGISGVLATATAVATAIAGDAKKYNPKKAAASILGGSALGTALAYGAAVNAPEAPAPVVQATPASTLHIETCGGDLCKGFKAAENVTVSVDQDTVGPKTYILNVPQGYKPE